MNEIWYIRLKRWVCKAINHPIRGTPWIHNNKQHADCTICGCVVSKPIESK